MVLTAPNSTLCSREDRCSDETTPLVGMTLGGSRWQDRPSPCTMVISSQGQRNSRRGEATLACTRCLRTLERILVHRNGQHPGVPNHLAVRPTA